MKRVKTIQVILISLLFIMFVLHTASAQTLQQQFGEVEDFSTEPFSTATQKSRFVFAADVYVPAIEYGKIPIYEVTLRAFSEEDIGTMAAAFGLGGISAMVKAEHEPIKPWNPYLIHYSSTHGNPFDVVNSYQQTSMNPVTTYAEFYLKPGRNAPLYTLFPYTLPISSQTLGDNMSLDRATELATAIATQIAPDLSLNLVGEMRTEAYLTAEDTINPDGRGINAGTLPMAYKFDFTRVVGGIPITHIDSSGSGEDESHEPYTDFYQYEWLGIAINDAGLAGVRYNSPYEIKGVWKPDSGELLSFEKIVGIAKTLLPLKFASRELSALELAEYQIHHIAFGYARVMMPNESNRCILIPVWDFFGTERFSYNDGRQLNDPSEGRIVETNSIARSLLTLDAVTGVVIDRELGY